MEKQLSEKIEKALRKLMDEDHYKINAFQLQEWLIDATKLETHKINLLSKGDVSGQFCRFGCELRDGIWYAKNGHRCASVGGQNCH